MSAPASFAKLTGPVKDLVTASVEHDSSLVGTEQSQVDEWIDKVGQGDIVKHGNFEASVTRHLPDLRPLTLSRL